MKPKDPLLSRTPAERKSPFKGGDYGYGEAADAALKGVSERLYAAAVFVVLALVVAALSAGPPPSLLD